MAYGVYTRALARHWRPLLHLWDTASHGNVTSIWSTSWERSHQHYPCQFIPHPVCHDGIRSTGWWQRYILFPPTTRFCSITSVFYKKPLLALCRMILHHNLYIADTGESKQTRTVNENAQKQLGELAKCVADYFVKHCGFDVGTPSFLFEGDEWMDPGPIVDLSGAYADWDNTPLRRKSSQLENGAGPSLEDIISREWIPPSLRGTDKDDVGIRSLRSRINARQPR